MVTLQRFIEGSDEKATGRIAYAVFPAKPLSENGHHWHRDPNFSIARELSHDPLKGQLYREALAKGFVVLQK